MSNRTSADLMNEAASVILALTGERDALKERLAGEERASSIATAMFTKQCEQLAEAVRLLRDAKFVIPPAFPNILQDIGAFLARLDGET